MNTERSLYEIEVALAKTNYFNFVRNIIAFNVNGISAVLPIFHECDMLVLSKSGYLTEIEIKRSWSDFMADFRKKHKHESGGLIKYFYYCIPEILLDKAYDELFERKVEYTGIITYSEELYIKLHGKKQFDKFAYKFQSMPGYRKLSIEEQLQIARFGAMRSILLKEKLIKSMNNETIRNNQTSH